MRQHMIDLSSFCGVHIISISSIYGVQMKEVQCATDILPCIYLGLICGAKSTHTSCLCVSVTFVVFRSADHPNCMSIWTSDRTNLSRLLGAVSFVPRHSILGNRQQRCGMLWPSHLPCSGAAAQKHTPPLASLAICVPVAACCAVRRSWLVSIGHPADWQKCVLPSWGHRLPWRCQN